MQEYGITGISISANINEPNQMQKGIIVIILNTQIRKESIKYFEEERRSV
jgi:hypothetical protein